MDKYVNKIFAGDEQDLFDQHMKGVRRLKSDRRDPHLAVKKRQPENRNKFREDKQLHDPLSDEWEASSVEGEEFIFYAQQGLQFKTQKMLRQGKIIPEDDLDLHGLTVSEARQELIKFINFSLKRQIRCIRLVHGKGYRAGTHQKPVLKNKINSWLRQHPDIIAFSSAQPKDGGTGAVYVLIKASEF